MSLAWIEVQTKMEPYSLANALLCCSRDTTLPGGLLVYVPDSLPADNMVQTKPEMAMQAQRGRKRDLWCCACPKEILRLRIGS
jgi:hypothetical protein